MIRRGIPIVIVALAMLALNTFAAPGQPEGKKGATAPAKHSGDYRPDIVIAVKAAAAKDCGCGACAAKGCEPCRGKNCFYCAAKSLVANDCGCKGCDAKGCQMCGPGCDVCKFHLGPNAEAKAHPQAPKK